MGCCASTQAGDNDRPPSSPTTTTTPAPQPTTIQSTAISPILSSSSSNPLRAPTPVILHVPSTLPSRSQSQTPSRTSTPLLPEQHPSTTSLSSPHPGFNSLRERWNTPLASPRHWTSTSKIWTPTQLLRERNEFFETRVTGRPEIWSALQNVCELLRAGDLVTGQGILDAAGITLPTGNLVDGCYDEVGNLYRLSEVVVSDPVNMRRDEGGESEEIQVDGSRNSHNIDGETMVGVSESKIAVTPEEEMLDGEAGELGKNGKDFFERKRLLEKKGKAYERDAVKVRCRLSDRGGPDVLITMGKAQHVATLVQRVRADGKVSPALKVRLVYFGKILSEKDTLDAQGWKEGHVINAMIVGDIAAPAAS